MKSLRIIHSFLMGILALAIVSSCTGQSPAELKNKISQDEDALSASCYGIKLDQSLLTKSNILKIFECGTWKDQYPDFYQSIVEIPEDSLNKILAPINDKIFYDLAKQKRFLDIVSFHEKQGDLQELGTFLDKALGEYNLLGQLNLVLNTAKFSQINRAQVLNFFSKDSEENKKAIIALSEFSKLYSQETSEWNKIFSPLNKGFVQKKVVGVLDGLANLDSNLFWNSSAKIFDSQNDQGFKNWARESAGTADASSLLLTLTRHKDLVLDSYNLKKILNEGIICGNRSSNKNFNIKTDLELITKMNDLATLDQTGYQKSILDGMAKLIAFKNFCSTKTADESLDTFSRITNTIMLASDIERDYNFIQGVQKTFPKGEEFALLDLLSNKGFESLHSFLIELEERNLQNSFSAESFKLIEASSDESMDFLANILKSISQDTKARSWYLNWSKMWKQLDEKQKLEFVNLLSIAFDQDMQADKAISLLASVVTEFPDLTSTISQQFDDESYYDILKLQVEILSTDKVRSDMRRFFSHEGMISFLRTFIRSRDFDYKGSQIFKNSLILQRLVVAPEMKIQSLERQCYTKLQQDYLNKKDYYTIVNTLPEICLNSLGEFGLVGQIYLWMNKLNKEFIGNTGKTFHDGIGVWSPGMIQFIFSAAVRADIFWDREHSLGVKDKLPLIQKDLENPIVKERFQLILNLTQDISTKTSALDYFMTEIAMKSDNDLKKEGRTLLSWIEKDPGSYLKIKSSTLSCKDLNPNIGANPCLSQSEFKKSVIEILEVMKRKNENGQSVITSLLRALHPKIGISLPMGSKKPRKKVFTLDEIIRFAHDLNTPATLKEFIYHNADSKTKFKGTTVERLEVIIRDISFLDNFYGAYFKNELSQAENYKEKLNSSESLMGLLQGLGGPLRTFKSFPKESKWLIKNARQTYSSLGEIAHEYTQPEGGTRNYADFIQGVLTIASSTSPLETQSFSAIRTPKVELVKGHNGIFITKVTQLSGLRHLSSWLDSRMGSRYADILKSSDFKSVNQNLIAKIDEKDFVNVGEYFFENYLSKTDRRLEMIVGDMIDWTYSATPSEINEAEELISKILILASQNEITSSDIKTIAQYAELAIQNWAMIKSIWPSNVKLSEVIGLANMMMDKILDDKKESSATIHSLVSALSKLPMSERKKLFDKSIMSKTSILLESFIKKDLEAQIEWSPLVAKMFLSEEVKFSSVKHLLTEMIKYPDSYLTVKDFILFLNTPQNGKTRYELLVEEVFVTQREKLERFLESTFQALQ